MSVRDFEAEQRYFNSKRHRCRYREKKMPEPAGVYVEEIEASVKSIEGVSMEKYLTFTICRLLYKSMILTPSL